MKGEEWTREQIVLLYRLYPVIGPTRILRSGKLGRHTLDSIRMKALHLGIRYQGKPGPPPGQKQNTRIAQDDPDPDEIERRAAEVRMTWEVEDIVQRREM